MGGFFVVCCTLREAAIASMLFVVCIQPQPTRSRLWRESPSNNSPTNNQLKGGRRLSSSPKQRDEVSSPPLDEKFVAPCVNSSTDADRYLEFKKY